MLFEIFLYLFCYIWELKPIKSMFKGNEFIYDTPILDTATHVYCVAFNSL